MKRFSRNIAIFLIALLLVLPFASCQSSADDEQAAEEVQIAGTIQETEPAQAEEVSPVPQEESVPEEAPVSITYEYMGYELTIEAYDGYALITYPQGATEEEVALFLAEEAARHQTEGVTYSFEGKGLLRLDYPEGIPASERRELADTLASDLIVYVSPSPEVEPATAMTALYGYNGYELSATIADGRTVLSYPDFITESEAAGFFEFENARYDLAGLGVTYSFDAPGTVSVMYPSSYAPETVKAELDILVGDLIAYITVVPESIQEPVSVETVINEIYTYGGYELEATLTSGRTVINYPAAVTESDAEAFFGLENERYGLADIGVRYAFTEPGTAVFTYPESITAEEAAAMLDTLVLDLIVYLTPAPEAVSVIVPPDTAAYGYNGYTLAAEISDGKTVLTYPSSVSDDDAEAFMAYENEKYGLSDLGIVYYLSGEGTAVFTYPETISRSTVKSELDVLVSDLIAYITPAPAPAAPAPEAVPAETVSYEYNGYALAAEISDGKTVLTYPSSVSDDDAEAFIAYENERYGLSDLGIVYYLSGEGTAVFTYPETISRSTVKSELDVLVSDLIAYITPAPAPAAAPAAAPVPAEVEYPFGVTPVVKAEGDTDGFTLYIGHTNDVHGRILPGEDGSLGYAKLDTPVKMARSYTDDELLLDGGDTLHGTNLANMFEGQSVLEIMDMIGYDAMVPGNHDFNYGAARLEEAAEWAEENSSLRILSANITDADGALVFQPYQLYDFNGFQVCVIGLTTPDTKTKSHPKNTEGLEFMSDEVLENAQAAIDIADAISDFVIVLGHIGVVPDGESGITSELICQSLDGIDLFIDAHSHTVMDGGEMVNGTLIVSTGQYLNNLGIVEVDVAADGSAEIGNAFLLPASEVLDPSSGTLLRSLGIEEVPDDPDVSSYAAAKEEELDRILGTVVAEIPMSLNGERHDVRTMRTNLSSLICEAMTAESGADFTIVNGGGIRASLAAGPVTLGDINNVLPFTNIITVCEISPADVYAALEHGYSMLPEENGAFSQTDLKIVYSASAPAGERVRKVFLGDELLDRNDTETSYKVATNDFMAAGGDGYTMFGRVLTEGSMLNEVFCDYLSELYPAD